MLSWFRRNVSCSGAVLFRGPLPPRAEELDGLAAQGVEVVRLEPRSDWHWALELRHASWGRAEVVCPRDQILPPRELIEWDPRLSTQEKEEALAFGSFVVVRTEPRTSDVLRDRKLLLRFLDAVMGSHGLAAIDQVAQSCWPRAALRDELGHDAAVDVCSLFTIHMVNGPEGEVFWLHSHGLKEIGFFDFDIIDPNRSCYNEGYDSLRALAFGIVEGHVVADGGELELVRPGGTISLVSARRFEATTAKGEHPQWRGSIDDEHLDGHAVVCDPQRRSWFGFGGRGAPRPSRFFFAPFAEGGVIQFSTEASLLMADRARSTYAAFRGLLEELAEYELPALVKLGYVVDGESTTDREHLWFEVHACGEQGIDATLVNQPFQIARMKRGDRGTHPADLISEWTIFTPFGRITPACGMALREVRSRPDELRQILRAQTAKEKR